MKYYYDFEQNEYISETKLLEIYNQLKAENSIDYSFPHFKMNCLSVNNGSLITLYARKNELSKQLFDYKLDSYETGIDFSDEIETIENELSFVKSLMEGE